MKRQFNLKKILNQPTSLSEKFHYLTKLKKKGLGFNPKNKPESWKKNFYKGYSRFKETRLPVPSLPAITIEKALINRKSSRKFGKKPITIDQLSSLLYFSAGLRSNQTSSWITDRFYPSGGARYPLETYIISLNMKELPRGLYHYYLRTHSLEHLMLFDSFDYLQYFKDKWIQKSSCLIIITAVFKRTTVKYKNRGYRYILIETGHLSQNIYLNASVLNIGCCACGGFVDDQLNNFLDIDGVNEATLYVLGIGSKLSDSKL